MLGEIAVAIKDFKQTVADRPTAGGGKAHRSVKAKSYSRLTSREVPTTLPAGLPCSDMAVGASLRSLAVFLTVRLDI